MPKLTILYRLGLLCLTGLAQSASAQVPDDSSFVIQARDKAERRYWSEFGVYLPIYQGTNWTSPGPTVQGSTFYPGEKPVRGSLNYLGQQYENTRLLYDALKDRLLVQTNDESRLFMLPSQKIYGFTLEDLTFIRPSAASVKPGLSDTGFYQVLYAGKSEVLVKRSKVIAYQPTEDPPNVLVTQSQYFVFNGDRFVLVNSMADLASLKGKKSKGLQKRLRAEKLRFKDNPEKTLIRAAEWYDQSL